MAEAVVQQMPEAVMQQMEETVVVAGDDEAENRSVIVLGLSQNGKTTFINSLLQFQGAPQAGHVGTGTQSCTKNVTTYKLHKEGHPTKFLDFKALPELELDDECPKCEGPMPCMVRDFDGCQHIMLCRCGEQSNLDTIRRRRWEKLCADKSYVANVNPIEPVVAGCRHVHGIPRRGGVSPVTTTSPLMALCRTLLRQGDDSLDNERGTAKRKLDAKEDASPKLQIIALDTPGVADGGCKDDEIILDIIDNVIEVGSLSAIIMVTKFGGGTCGEHWQAQIQRYYDLFPMLRSQWIFVHTQGDPYCLNSPERADESSFEAACLERVEVVMKAMREKTKDETFDAAHLFFESNLKVPKVIAVEPLKELLARQHNSLYSLIANFSPVPISFIPFAKGPTLCRIDSQVKGALEAEIRATTSTIAEHDAELGRMSKMQDAHAEVNRQFETQINSKRIVLVQITTTDPLETHRYASASWRFFRFASTIIDVTTSHREYELGVVDCGGQQITRPCWLRVTELNKVPTPDNKWTLTLKLEQRYLWSDLNARIVLTSEKRLVYAADIATQTASIAQDEMAFSAMKQVQQTAIENLNCKKTMKEDTERRKKESEAMLVFLTSEWNCDAYRAMKPFYDKAKVNDNWNTLELLQLFKQEWSRISESIETQPLGGQRGSQNDL